MPVLFFLVFCASSEAQWTQTNGLAGKTVFSIVKAGSLMFAGASTSVLTSGDIYVSSDGGNNWSIVTQGLNLSGVFSLIFKDNMVYAGTYEDGLQRTTDNGASWVNININNNPQTGVFELCQSGQNIFAYTNTGMAYYVTSNNGSNWSVAAGYNGGVTNDLLDNGTSFYAATYKGLYLSTNNGFNWSQRQNNGLPANPDGSKRLIAIVNEGSNLFGSTNNPVNSIYRSTDEGNNWMQMGLTLTQNAYIKSLEKSPGRLYAGISGANSVHTGVWSSTDQGSTWFAVNAGFPALLNVNALLRSDNVLFACTSQNGVWKADINTLTPVEATGSSIVPAGFRLEQIYPNPFNPSTNVKFTVPPSLAGRNFLMRVIDLTGKVIRTLLNDDFSAGTYETELHVEDVSTGVYIVQLSTGEYSLNQRIVLLK
ncbi:MAG: T9SS type A sorting domain-containing protein [Ignavibacteria bacterium]|nr:T9SS type A sorting domain-containing protein [Ignavibacteria bacterium]